MSNFKGTKGKWTYSKQDGVPGHCYQAQIWRPDGFGLAEIEPTSNEIEATANALLISKAPEMLEILEDILNVIDWSTEHWQGNGGKEREQKIKQLIKEATEL